MRKIFIGILLLTIVFLCGCSRKKTTQKITADSNGRIEEDKVVRYEIDLTMDNYWKYFDNVITDYEVGPNNYNAIIYENIGILNYAYYEDVAFTLELSYITHNPYAEKEEDKNKYHLIGNVTMLTKADGSGSFRFSNNYLGEEPEHSLYSATKCLKVVGITGKVIFSI